MRRFLIGPALGVMLILLTVAPAAGISYGQIDTPTDGVDVGNVGALIGEFEGQKFIFCSGTLIAPRAFLTASHCVDDGATMWVSFDPSIPEPVGPPTTLYQGTAHAHPDFASGGANNTFDVAVIVLDGSVAGITPALLPTQNMLAMMSSQQLKRAQFLTAGYGTVRETRQGAFQPLFFDGQRRWARQHVYSLTKAWLTLSMNQATGDGGTCYGDSGGPHFLGRTVVALTVTGDRWCKATDKTYRVDTTWSRDFLDEFVAVP